MKPFSQSTRRWLLIGGLVLGVAAVGVIIAVVLVSTAPEVAQGPSQPDSTGKPVPSDEQRLVAGKAVYTNHCAQCHGDTGDGSGAAARFLYPKPRDFRGGKYRLVTTDNRVPSDADLMQVITRGMPGSAMMPFGHLQEDDRVALVAYVRHLTRVGIEERIRQAAAAAGDEVDPAQLAQDVKRLSSPGQLVALPAGLPPSEAESIARGLVLYKAQCATCHGETGKGDGAKEQREDDGTPTRPRDFTRGIFKGGRDLQQLYARVAIGMPGTPMPASPHLKPAEIGDMVNFVQSLSDPAAQAKVEHKRTLLVAKRTETPLPDAISEEQWRDAPAVPIVVSPLWWRDYAEPELRVQALHDGKSLAIRLTWKDETRNESAVRPEDFEDQAAVQLFKGDPEPFLGMGSETGKLDLWLWQAGGERQIAAADNKLEDYPFDTPLYRELLKGTPLPDFLTARAAGNPIAERAHSASSLGAKGFGSTTFRPQASQFVRANATWNDSRWSLVLRRRLQVKPEDGLVLVAGERCSVAFAIWDGAARDRNGQKLISIWHDLKLE